MSSDCNDINMSTIKADIIQIVKPVNHIYNVSFNTGLFPNNIKIAQVLPIFTNGDKGVFSNCKPISLLPEFSNILEKSYNDWLDNFFYQVWHTESMSVWLLIKYINISCFIRIG